MTEENEVQETAQEEQVAQVETQQESSQEESVKKDSDHHNWKEVHQVLRQQKQQIEELTTKLMERQQPIPQEEPDEFANLDPNDYLPVEKAKKLAEKIAEKKASQTAREIVQEYLQQQTVTQDEQRMRTKHDDYDYIIENFALPQIKNDPALAYKIQQSKNPAETAYRLGKLSDAYQDSSSKQQVSPKAEKILKNSQRPVSSTAVTSSLKSQADQFSKMTKQDVWSLSEKYARGGA